MTQGMKARTPEAKMKSPESRVKSQRELFPGRKRTKSLPRNLHNSIGFQNCYGPVTPLYLLLSHPLTGMPRAVNLATLQQHKLEGIICPSCLELI